MKTDVMQNLEVKQVVIHGWIDGVNIRYHHYWYNDGSFEQREEPIFNFVPPALLFY